MLPCPISQGEPMDSLPEYNNHIIKELDYYIVENTRSARRFLSSLKLGLKIDELEFVELNEHTSPSDVEQMLAPLLVGRSAGVISEAGVPGVADPGADVAALAHQKGVRVMPLVGPSSIILSMMASGLNGQSFAFNGYLPVKSDARIAAIRRFEKRLHSEGQSQAFIEAPYRNGKLFEDFIKVCAPQTRLCVAMDILDNQEFIRTMSIAQWRKEPMPDMHKRPCIFIIG